MANVGRASVRGSAAAPVPLKRPDAGSARYTAAQSESSPPSHPRPGRHRRGAAGAGGKPPTGRKSGQPEGEEPMVRKAIRISGEVVMTLGVIVLLFAVYALFGDSFGTYQKQNKLNNEIENAWEQQRDDGKEFADKFEIGDAVAKLYIPRMNKSWVVVEGEDPADIRYAPGRFRDSELPGQPGNFAIAGHRTPPIWFNLHKVEEGDKLVVQTATTWYIYNVYESIIVEPTQVDVVEPDPNDPSRELITLVTCNPLFENYERLIVHGELERQQPFGDGEKPKELT